MLLLSTVAGQFMNLISHGLNFLICEMGIIIATCKLVRGLERAINLAHCLSIYFKIRQHSF
jgi:hypothetical protein